MEKSKTIKFLSAVAIAFAFITGCSHSSNNTNPYGYYNNNGWWGSQYGVPGMPGYNGYTTGFVGAGIATSGQAMVILDFAANTSTGIATNQASYVTGQLDVFGGIPCAAGGGLPAGVYQLMPPNGNASPNGEFDGSLGQNITLIANGPVQAQIVVPDAYIANGTRVCSQFPGMTGYLDVDEVAEGGYGSVYCGASVGFTDQVQTGQYCQ